jgi:hypothetical protein
VRRANNDEIGFDEALKIITQKVDGAGKLLGMHILSVLTLTGNCFNREFLRRATLTDACSKQVRDKLFPGEEIKPAQMKTALNGVVRSSGMSEAMVENMICESLRSERGYDTFHPSQKIYYMDEPTDNIICVGSNLMVTEVRSEDDDRKSLESIPRKDRVEPYYKWWKASGGKKEIHDFYLYICEKRGVDPKAIIVRPHLQSITSNGEVWEKYLRKMNKSIAKDCQPSCDEESTTNDETFVLGKRRMNGKTKIHKKKGKARKVRRV